MTGYRPYRVLACSLTVLECAWLSAMSQRRIRKAAVPQEESVSSIKAPGRCFGELSFGVGYWMTMMAFARSSVLF